MKQNPDLAKWLTLVAALALFAYMLHVSTAAIILSNARKLGFGFLGLLLLSGMRQGLRTVAWHRCMDAKGNRPGLLELFGLRLVCEALNDATPAGPLLGETAKVLVVSRRMPTFSSVKSLLLENLIYGFAAVLFMLSGVVLALVTVAASREGRWGEVGLAAFFVLSLALCIWKIRSRVVLFGVIIDRLRGWGLNWALVARHERELRRLEMEISDFFLTRRSLFLCVLAIEISTNFTGIGEGYLVLRATTTHPSLLAAYLVESASRAVQLAFVFVPYGLGVQEGAAATTVKVLGYSSSVGVSLALFRKARTLVWAAMGLVLAVKLSTTMPAGQRHTTEL